MTTIEKLFVQISESKKRIIEQIKNQAELFDQHLASKCLLDGIAPPSWLLSSSFPSFCSDPNELKKEELLSGLLLPHSQPPNPYLSSYFSLYQQHIIPVDNDKGLKTNSCTEIGASNNAAKAGDRLSVLPSLQNYDNTQGAFNGVAELDPSVTSPPDCGDARMLDSCTGHGQSFSTELDPSVTSPPVLGDARMSDDCARHVQPFVDEFDPSVASPPDCGDARVLDNCADHSQSLVKIIRSKARQRDLQLRNSTKGKSKLCDENKDGGVYTIQGIGSGISSLQYDHVRELELVKPNDTNNGGCNEEKAKIGECGSKDKNSNIYNGGTIGSRNSTQQASFVNEPGNDGNSSYIAKEEDIKCAEDLKEHSKCSNAISELANRSVLVNENCMPEEANAVDCNGNETNDVVWFDRITGSGSSISQTKQVLEVGNSSCVAEEHKEFLDKSSAKQPSCVSGLLGLVKSSSIISNDSCGSRKAKTGGKQIKEKGSNSYVGRITRSRKSSQPSYRASKSPDQDNPCGNGKELKQLSNHVHDLTEMVMPLDVTCESDGVKEAARECQNIDVENDAYCCRITSSSIEKLNNVMFSKVDNSSYIVKDGDVILAQSFDKPSQPPQLSSLVQGARVNIQVLSSAQPNVLPSTENLLPESDIDGDAVVEVHSVTYASNSDGARCGVEASELGPPNECAVVVNPKKLDFGDAEENNLLEACDPAMEDKQEDKEKLLSPLVHSTDVLEKATSVGYCEQPNLSIEKPLLKEQEFFRKSCKDSSEGHMQGGTVLVDESTINSGQQKMNSFNSQNRKADSYFTGSWPQHKRIKIGGQATGALSASPSLKIIPYQPMQTYYKGDPLLSVVVKSTVEDIHQNVEHEKIEESEVSSFKLQVDEVENRREGMAGGSTTDFSLILEQGASSVSNSKRLAAGVSQGCLSDKAEVADPVGIGFDMIEQDNAEEDQDTGDTIEENHVLFQLEDDLKLGDAEVLNHTEEDMHENAYHFEGKGTLSFWSSGSPLRQFVIHDDQNIPEFEGFVMGADDEPKCTANEGNSFDNLDLPPAELGRASVLERLCKSTCLHTPLSHFSATYNLHEALNFYQSIPNGLLEGMELRSTLNMNGDGCKQLGANDNFLDEEINHDLHGRSHSISLPLSNAHSAWDITKPCMSPVGKFWDGIPLKSGSSGKRVSSIPELPCISEENEATDGVPDRLLEGAGPELSISSVKREPLADITKHANPITSVCEAEICEGRGSLGSMNTEISFSGTCDRAKTKLGNKKSNKRRFTSKDKENHNISLGVDGNKRGNGSLHSRFSRPKLSGKADLRKGGLSLLEKESKPTNIVSNIASFVTLVQQKQAAAVITGKRDIKVKALEAAEAAKRNAQKKENERKMRKEAMKRERVKMEEQNLRQLELEKKKKEEEKRKKEADMAAKKRHREEEERKEKERKRMRVEESKRHHLAHEKRLHAEKEEKELKFKAPDEKAHESKESKTRLGKHDKMEKAKGDSNLQPVPQSEPVNTKVSTIDTINASVIAEDHKTSSDCGDNLKVMASIREVSESGGLNSSITQEQSYEISPYKGSDDEDEDEDDDIRKSKFIPSWASKCHLALVVSSQQRIVPESIFPPESFCSISEVLLPRRLQQK
ncbi:uncharacterized protein LOC8266953 [Ricinus communis]|uniref:uncharacterized protein LOC8266953 n=1 Tax=Ricinus communis TaxID=3988 RepID=UPI00201A924B|nr:uncharacterized protein LOC8266953 [Ricinus communis]XP_048235127.1 uncharacterized protein LOC8266953 [Ricinus communis]